MAVVLSRLPSPPADTTHSPPAELLRTEIIPNCELCVIETNFCPTWLLYVQYYGSISLLNIVSDLVVAFATPRPPHTPHPTLTRNEAQLAPISQRKATHNNNDSQKNNAESENKEWSLEEGGKKK